MIKSMPHPARTREDHVGTAASVVRRA
jgi:hypothetical protein